MHSPHRSSARPRTPSAGFAWLFAYFQPSPSHSPPTHPLHTQLFLARFGRDVFHDFAVALDSRRVVDLLPEYDGGVCYADHFTVEDLVPDADEISLVVRCVDHRHEAGLRLEHALELELVDEESGDSRRALSRLRSLLGSDQRLERIATSLRVVAVRVGRGRLLEDF